LEIKVLPITWKFFNLIKVALSINQELIKRSRVPHFTLQTFLLYFSVTRALTTQCPPKLANASHKLTERKKKNSLLAKLMKLSQQQ